MYQTLNLISLSDVTPKNMFFEPKSMFQRLFKHETIVFTFCPAY